MISQVLVRQNFSRFKPNPQNPKISYGVITSNEFSSLPDLTIRHETYQKNRLKKGCICHCAIYKKHQLQLKHEFSKQNTFTTQGVGKCMGVEVFIGAPLSDVFGSQR
jgi:hypothetical protein